MIRRHAIQMIGLLSFFLASASLTAHQVSVHM